MSQRIESVEASSSEVCESLVGFSRESTRSRSRWVNLLTRGIFVPTCSNHTCKQQLMGNVEGLHAGQEPSDEVAPSAPVNIAEQRELLLRLRDEKKALSVRLYRLRDRKTEVESRKTEVEKELRSLNLELQEVERRLFSEILTEIYRVQRLITEFETERNRVLDEHYKRELEEHMRNPDHRWMS